MPFSGSGSGTVGDPYQVTDATQLAEVGDDLTAHYIQTADIDCVGVADFRPLDEGGVGFSGHLSCYGFTITNFNQEWSATSSFAGLFATILADGIVEGIDISGEIDAWDVTGSMDGGGIVSNNYGIIRNCICHLNISNDYIGGIAYDNAAGATISTCLFVGILTTDPLTVGHEGGIVSNNEGTITNCYYDKTVEVDATGINSGLDLTTAQLRGDATLPTGFDPAIWTKDETPLEAYPYSYPRLLRNDEMATAFTIAAPSTDCSGGVATHWTVNGTSSDITSTAQELKAAVTGRKHCIKSILISSKVATTCTIQDGATAVLGPFALVAEAAPVSLTFKPPIAMTAATAINAVAANTGVVTIVLQGFTV
jgi:hypothetical protein